MKAKIIVELNTEIKSWVDLAKLKQLGYGVLGKFNKIAGKAYVLIRRC